MIKIRIINNEFNDIIGLEIKGHSSNIDKEKEIVCASISALSMTSLLGLINYLNINCSYEIQDGYLYFKIKNYDNIDTITKSNIQSVLNVILLGIKNISINYQNHILFI